MSLQEEHNWRQIEALLDDAFALPEQEQVAWLTEACGTDTALLGEVLSLLKADQSAQDLLTTGESLGSEHGIGAMISALGSRLGPYELIKPLGHGGMGQVFLGRRVDGQFDQQVAIKFLSLQMDAAAQRHFRAECQNLARLDHPNIVNLLDAGVAENGISYLVMQLVEGETIDLWAQRTDASLEQRIEVLRDLADAVAHAHRHLIIHRDIKPSNILVTADGQPKLLDFGISRDMDDEGTATHSLMSPRFAAPEQILGQSVTTSTDVYGLGVIAHLVLTGRPPFADDDASIDALVARTKRPEPPLPSALPNHATAPLGRSCLKGDLDAIVLKCLQTEVTDRYESAATVRDDWQAWLTRRPVTARRPSIWQKSRSFVRRHQLTTSLLAIGLIGAVSAMSFHLNTVRVERDAAVAASDFLLDLITEVNPYQRSADNTMVIPLTELYATGLRQLKASAIPIKQKIDLALALADGAWYAQDPIQALAAADQAIAWAESNSAFADQLLRAKVRRTGLLPNADRTDEALKELSRLAQGIGNDIEETSELAARIHFYQGDIKLAAGKARSSVPHFEQAEVVLSELPLDDDIKLLYDSHLMRFSAAHSRLGNAEQARALSDRQIELSKQWFGEDHIRHVRALGQAVTLGSLGSPEEDIALAKRAFHGARRVLGEDAGETLSMHNNYALKLAYAGDNEAAIEQYRNVIELSERVGRQPTDSYQNMASSQRVLGLLDDAWESTEYALAAYGTGFWRLAMPLITRTEIALTRGDAQLAASLAQQAIDETTEPLGREHYITRVARGLVMAANVDAGDCISSDIALTAEVLQQTIDQTRNRFVPAHLERAKRGNLCL